MKNAVERRKGGDKSADIHRSFGGLFYRVRHGVRNAFFGKNIVVVAYIAAAAGAEYNAPDKSGEDVYGVQKKAYGG